MTRSSAASPTPSTARRLWLRHACAALASSGWLPGEVCAAQSSVKQAVLTVSGKVRKPNQGDVAVFDMAMLAAMPQHSIDTKTPWYPQSRTFTGPLLRDVLAACGAQGELLRLLALNDFRMDMPVTDPQRFDIVLAHLLDGKPMSVRDKGPLFVMYPFSARAELRSTIYYSRAVWQLHTIEVL